MIRCLAALLLMSVSAQAQTRDEVFATLYQRLDGTLLGDTYDAPGAFNRSQRWICQTCEGDQRILIGWYDWAVNYATDDPARVLRAITGACQFDTCTTEPYAAVGLTGVEQYGVDWGAGVARTFLIAGDRMWSFEAEGFADVAAARTYVRRAEALVLPMILAVAP